MTEPAVLTEARAMIRAGAFQPAIDRLMAALAGLPIEHHRHAYNLAGLAFYFGERWPDALGMFQAAANGSEVPEDWFNVAMAQVKVGDITGGLASWQKTFDLSYAHKDAPETSTFFQKKLMFAQALLDAGHGNEVGLDLLERQLMGFFTHYHVTDTHFWMSRGVPPFEDVMRATLAYYRALGKTDAEWEALCDRVSAGVDDEGKAFCGELRAHRAP